jgi:chromate transporter
MNTPTMRPGSAQEPDLALSKNPAQPTEPISVWALFLGFSIVGLSGFGGVLPFARRLLVEQRRWLSGEEFNSLMGLCQFLPGPNVVNLAVCVGRPFAGVSGAIGAVLGLMGGPMLVALGLGWLYDQYGSLPIAQGALRGIAAVGAGLLIAMGWRMAQNLKAFRRERWFVLLAFAGVAVFRFPLPWVMLSLATINGLWVYRLLGHAETAGVSK